MMSGEDINQTSSDILDDNTSNLNEEQSGQEVSEDTNEIDGLKAELEAQKDKYLRLYSEFDNFRKRTAKEKIDLIQTAGKDLMIALLPVIDDLERAQKSLATATDIQSVTEGLELVFNKFLKTLETRGLKAIDAIGEPFDSEVHEAVTQIPAPSEEMKGKVVDVVEKGYQLHDKIIRYSKVVIGS